MVLEFNTEEETVHQIHAGALKLNNNAVIHTTVRIGVIGLVVRVQPIAVLAEKHSTELVITNIKKLQLHFVKKPGREILNNSVTKKKNSVEFEIAIIGQVSSNITKLIIRLYVLNVSYFL